MMYKLYNSQEFKKQFLGKAFKTPLNQHLIRQVGSLPMVEMGGFETYLFRLKISIKLTQLIMKSTVLRFKSFQVYKLIKNKKI